MKKFLIALLAAACISLAAYGTACLPGFSTNGKIPQNQTDDQTSDGRNSGDTGNNGNSEDNGGSEDNGNAGDGEDSGGNSGDTGDGGDNGNSEDNGGSEDNGNAGDSGDSGGSSGDTGDGGDKGNPEDNGGSEDNGNAGDGEDSGSSSEDTGDGGDKGDGGAGGGEEEPPAVKEYRFKTQTMGGKNLSGIVIKLMRGGAEVTRAVTSAGSAKVSVLAGDYDLSFDNLPEGYFVNRSRTLTHIGKNDTEVVIKFDSSVLSPLTQVHKYAEGEVMHDFTVTDADGVTVNLKQLLTEYDLVLLNFWYINCGPCKMEFPAMQSVYRRYSDKVFMVCLSNEDTPTAVKNFKKQQNYTFFMAADQQNILSPSFVTRGYPTNVFIDRYGVIDFMDCGYRDTEAYWEDKFARYTGDGYGGTAPTSTETVLPVCGGAIDFSQILPDKFL